MVYFPGFTSSSILQKIQKDLQDVNLKSLKIDSLAKVTQDSTPVSTLGTMKELKESTPKLDGDGILLQPHQAHLRRGGSHLKNGGRHQVGMNRDHPPNLTPDPTPQHANTQPITRPDHPTQYTTPNHPTHRPNPCFLSFLVLFCFTKLI